MTVDVLNIQGEKTGRSVELPAEVFNITPNEHAMYLAVKQYLARQRQGTHKTKEKGEVSFSTRKIKRQKGTGTARAGSLKSPLFRKGGRVFGPKPHKYEVKLNKKVKQLARLSALSVKAQGGQLIVMEDFTLESPKTSEYVNILNNLEVGSKTLLVTKDHDQTLYLSSRNVSDSTVISAGDLNTYDILKAKKLILSEEAITAIQETFAS
jgi:large subunit ribosomal protein L4